MSEATTSDVGGHVKRNLAIGQGLLELEGSKEPEAEKEPGSAPQQRCLYHGLWKGNGSRPSQYTMAPERPSNLKPEQTALWSVVWPMAQNC